MWLWPCGRRILAALCAPIVLASAIPSFAQLATNRHLPEPITEWHTWLRSRLTDGKGPYDFALTMFTGNMASDPDHAEAQRRLISAWLNTTILPGDTVIVAGAEHRVWTASGLVTIENDPESRRKAFSLLPAGPEPGSRGGKSIERVLFQLADRVGRRSGRGTALIMLSNGWSQAGEGSEEAIGRLEDMGFAVHREVFAVPTLRSNRHVLVTACIRGPSAVGSLKPRVYGMAPTEWVPSAYTPVLRQEPGLSADRQETQPTTDRQERRALPIWMMALAALVMAGAGLAAGRWTRRPAPAASAAPTLPALPIADRLAELEAVMDNARTHAAELQKVRDSLRELVANTERPAQPEPIGRAEAGDLRTELASVQHKLAEWDRTAIAYLEAAEAAVRNDAADERLRRTWQRAADSFCRMAQRHGFSRIAPKPGEPFVPGLHRAVVVEGDPARANLVAECLAWGYQNGANVYKLADVRVVEQSSHSR